MLSLRSLKGVVALVLGVRIATGLMWTVPDNFLTQDDDDNDEVASTCLAYGSLMSAMYIA